ncbi:carbon-nitrogen hydrolase family protein [Promicromonospora sp. NPDC059942]|uniref:carbon-nitrogen hydrolase family protein n=1 Tax=Promicromonospora sp. NPDC059942 TaxID=3347009 RepID=UPI00364AC213
MAPSNSLRIAIAQTTISADARQNGETVRRLMREAAEAGARLIQFPEGCLSGYAKEQISDWDQVDWSAVEEEHHRVAGLAADLRLWVVLGSTHRLTPPHRPHNSLYVIDDAGQVVGRYDKRYCSHTEINHYYTPGFEPMTFSVDGFTFGCAICVEINFPELFSEYERLDVDCLLLSAYPVDSIFEVKARAHAAINNYWLAMSTPAQTAHLLRSELIGPEGTVLARVGAGAELVIGELDRGAPELQVALGKARPWRASAREGEIYRTRRVTDTRSADLTNF